MFFLPRPRHQTTRGGAYFPQSIGPAHTDLAFEFRTDKPSGVLFYKGIVEVALSPATACRDRRRATSSCLNC